MHALTHKIVAELDLLYGLYQLALDYTRKMQPENEDGLTRWLDARQKILNRTEASSHEAAQLLQVFDIERQVPSNERALVEEKRNMIHDVIQQIHHADNFVLKAMHSKLSEVRRELANHNERKNAIKAYIRAPISTMAVG